MYKEWFKAALIRAIRTFAEAALAYIGTGALVLKDTLKELTVEKSIEDVFFDIYKEVKGEE